MLDLLFVCGTLRSEFDNPYARKLRSEAVFMGRATTSGSIFRIDWYPAFRNEPPGIVHGELYRLNDPESMFTALDEYEGPDFERIMLDAPRAWIYRYVRQPPPESRILSGDFCEP